MPADRVHFQLFTRTSRSRKRKSLGEPIALSQWRELVAGFDALKLDGWSLVLGNNRNDLPPEGGFYDAELSDEVARAYGEQVCSVGFEVLAGALRQTHPSLDEVALADNLSKLHTVYREAMANDAWLDITAGP
ncbi:MAG: hypothetical protein JNM17_08680 [Archangium sp.]|nr:hypothetical protein [Archangium sp.]